MKIILIEDMDRQERLLSSVFESWLIFQIATGRNTIEITHSELFHECRKIKGLSHTPAEKIIRSFLDWCDTSNIEVSHVTI